MVFNYDNHGLFHLPPPSSGDNGSMHFWDWKTGHCFQQLQALSQPGSLDSEAGVFKACFDMSGCRLLTAEADKTIKMYKEDETAVSACTLHNSIITLTTQELQWLTF